MAIVVREDELEVNDRLEFLYRGTLFTGVAVELSRDGRKLSETSYVEGTQSGLCRDFAPDGTVLYEAHYDHGVLHGTVREYHPDGRLKLEVLFEKGIERSRREEREAGEL